VIRFLPGTNSTVESFEGGVEHIASYRSLRFHSPAELLDFIAAVLSELDDTDRCDTSQ
jgi:hypothetical protein